MPYQIPIKCVGEYLLILALRLDSCKLESVSLDYISVEYYRR
jgi:hypothetical protein